MNNFGPNVRELLILKISRDAIPDGGGLADGIEFFANAEKRKEIMSGAIEFVKAAICAVREAPNPNPFRDADDEAIAGELVRRAKQKSAEMHSCK